MKKYCPTLCICLLSAMLMAALAVSPGTKELMAEYSITESDAALLISLPYMVSIPFTLLAGRLTTRYSKKLLSITGGSIICITGLLPYVLNSFPVIAVIRACTGIGLGLLFTIAPSLAADYYPAGRLQNFAIGMQSAWAGSGGFVFNILSGYLVRTQPRNIYLVYCLCIVFTVLVLILLPYQPPRKAVQAQKSFDPRSLFVALLTFLFLIAGMTISLSMSVYMSELGIGSAVEAGYATSCYSATAFIFGCSYAALSQYLQKHGTLIACIISAIGMLFCTFGKIVPIYAGSAMVGAGLSIFMASNVNRIMRTTAPAAAAMSIAVMMVGSSIGQTFSAILINPLAACFHSSVGTRYGVSMAFFIVVALLSLLQKDAKPPETALHQKITKGV